MEGKLKLGNLAAFAGKYLPAAVFSLALFFIVYHFSKPFVPGDMPLALKPLWPAMISLAGFAIVKTGKTTPWRAIIFIAIAAGFLVNFKSYVLHLPVIMRAESPVKSAPYCHIALASYALTFIYQQYLALMSGNWVLWAPLSFGFFWLAVTLFLGRGWCSWVCFYGGIDEFFSSILPKPPVKIGLIPPKIRDFQSAFLIFLLLISVSSFLPVFCLWVCPFKINASFLDPEGLTRRTQIILMAATGIGFVVFLPLITGKRAFCGLICPFGAWQSFFGKINPFRITLPRSECSGCMACVKACPTFSIHLSETGGPEVLGYCNMCGKCVTACPGKKIRYTVLGNDLSRSLSGWASLLNAQTLFVFSALITAGTAAGIFMPSSINYLYRLIAER